MRTQEKVTASSNGRAHPLTRGVRDLVHDMISLAELQGELALWDLRESKSRLIQSGVLLTVAPVLAIAALPVLLLGLAGWLADGTNVSLFAAQLIVGGIVLAAGVGVGWWGWRKLANSLCAFQRSRDELSENLAWLKSVLRSPATVNEHPTGRGAGGL